MTTNLPRRRVPVRIRRAREADAAGIASCLQDAFATYRNDYSEAGYADTVLKPETCLLRLRRMGVLVADDESGGIAGTISFEVTAEHHGHLRGMAVRPVWWGTGLAAQLLLEAERQLALSDCGVVTLDTTAPLQRAAAFYRRQGYQPSGAVSDFFGMPLYRWAKTL